MKKSTHPFGQGPGAPIPMGNRLSVAMAHLSQGRIQQAQTIYQEILNGPTPHPDAYNWMGVIAYQTGDAVRALHLIQKALDIQPTNPLYKTSLGNVLQACGRLKEAEEAYKSALKSQPLNAELLNNLGCVLLTDGRSGEAVKTLRQAVEVRPGYAAAHCNLGNALKAGGQIDAAVASYQQALQIQPKFPDALRNLGMAHLAVGDYAKAIAVFQHALTLRNPFPEASYNLGLALQASGRSIEAIESWRIAVAGRQNYPEAYIHMANAYQAQGLLDEARDCYQKANANGNLRGLEINAALLLPPVMGTKEDVTRSRAQFEQNLQTLMQKQKSIEDPIKEYCNTNFYLAYHGLNDKAVQQKIAQFYEQACPGLKYRSPTLRTNPNAGKPIRVGFISKYLYSHSVSQCYGQVVKQLAQRSRFEIVLIAIGNASSSQNSSTYVDFVGETITVQEDLEKARETIAALSLDVLVYMDLGMEPFSYFLAYSRLAPVQCVLDGHPVTTGITAIDYFLTSAGAETAESEGSYSEKLIQLPFGAYYYERPTMPTRFKGRQELGMPQNGALYVCPMTLQKIHPDFDAAMEGILRQDETGSIVFFADKHHPSWQTMLESRFDKTIPHEFRNRIVFLPWASNYQDFICCMQQANVILDPFHFGIGVTAVAVFSAGTPFVTKPSGFARGRYGLYYSKILDTMECVAETTEEYVKKAVAIAHMESVRESIKTKILNNNNRLFENKAGIDELAVFLEEVGAMPSAH